MRLTKTLYAEAWEWDEREETLSALRAAGFPWTGHSGHNDSPGAVWDMRARVAVAGHHGEGSQMILKGRWIVLAGGRWTVFDSLDAIRAEGWVP